MENLPYLVDTEFVEIENEFIPIDDLNGFILWYQNTKQRLTREMLIQALGYRSFKIAEMILKSGIGISYSEYPLKKKYMPENIRELLDNYQTTIKSDISSLEILDTEIKSVKRELYDLEKVRREFLYQKYMAKYRHIHKQNVKKNLVPVHMVGKLLAGDFGFNYRVTCGRIYYDQYGKWALINEDIYPFNLNVFDEPYVCHYYQNKNEYIIIIRHNMPPVLVPINTKISIEENNRALCHNINQVPVFDTEFYGEGWPKYRDEYYVLNIFISDKMFKRMEL